jgi:phage terminase small subunit
MKKLIIYTTVGTVLVASSIFFASGVAAEDLVDSKDSFISRLSEKLGLKESEVVDVIDDVQGEVRAERQAERAELIAQALDEGKLTEKEAEILDVMEDIHAERGKPDDIENWREYTPEQKEALRGARRELRQQEIREELYNLGLEVTQEEMDELHQKMLDLGIGMYGRRGEKGVRMGRGMMMGHSQN